MLYMIVMRHTKFWLIGPFASKDAAGDYGTQNLDHDPRWQQIDLPELGDFVGARIYAPDVAANITDEDVLPNYTA